MGIAIRYPKRLIEVDLPIKRISAHARREKSIRHGHISTLHIWWARRPLAACRAVICASLWPDPADELCPDEFRRTARELMTKWAKNHLKLMSDESSKRFIAISKDDSKLDDNVELRKALLDFIADFTNWDNSTVPEYLKTSRALTQAAHEALGGETGSRPLVVDPFAGGGSIPLEALRVGADAFASDLNPIPTLLNHTLIRFIPKYGEQLADNLIDAAQEIQDRAEKRLSKFFPTSHAGFPPVAYIWGRQVRCEGPRCGVQIPLIRSLCLAQRENDSIGLELKYDKKSHSINISIVSGRSKFGSGTVTRGSVTCPACGYTTPVGRVREQLCFTEGGADSSRLLVVVCRSRDGKTYYSPTNADLMAIQKAQHVINRADILQPIELPLMSGVFNVPLYGITRWDLLFSSRQLLTAKILGEEIETICTARMEETRDSEQFHALKVLLLLTRGKYLDFRTTLCGWISKGEKIGHTFGRQALGMIFDWTEGTPFGDMSGSWGRCSKAVAKLIRHEAAAIDHEGIVEHTDACKHPLPDDSVTAVITDPPYYNAVPYADLSDFFYVWLWPHLRNILPSIFKESTVPKDSELCEMRGWDSVRYPHKDAVFYESGMFRALAEARRVCLPGGIAVIVFAHKTTTGWETLLGALVDAGWVVTGSWSIDTERIGRLRSMKSAALGSSVHLVCRPRENPDGSLRIDNIGDWRDVIAELPKRIHDWMPRLAEEGVVGADAIFACLGPALEIYSRYSSVEKASGEQVELKEYLEQVWAAVSREALKMIFEGADASGFEEDARLTAMWLWTLRTSHENGGISEDDEGKTKSIAGYDLEYDAARKIAQGLGAHLDTLGHLVKIKGDTATLLSAGARTRYLFGKDAGEAPKGRKKKKSKQLTFDFEGELKQMEEESGNWAGDLSGRAASTVLDQLHQSMILFGAGRGEALKRFLVDDGIGMNPLYWRLAQSLSALYPSGTDEKRWVDGVLARKKGLGL